MKKNRNKNKKKIMIIAAAICVALVGASFIGVKAHRISVQKEEARLSAKKKAEKAAAAKKKAEKKAALEKKKAEEEKLEAEKKAEEEKALQEAKLKEEEEAKKKAEEEKAAAPKQEKKNDKHYIVCLDPGHGGANEGAKYSYLEKNLTIKIARAMKARLEQFENITVVMTRDGDYDLTLDQRAAVAQQNKADFLISLHLNASSEHNLFGSEVWVPVSGSYYANGHAMADLLIGQVTGVGTYNKGVKVRDLKGDNYYGILKHSSERGVNSVIVEHCYMDNAHDTGFVNDATLTAFGQADALAVAKYFGLYSPITGENYFGYKKNTYDTGFHAQDYTGPESASLRVNSYDEATGQLSIHISAKDSDSGILYYQYSTDGGASWSDSNAWNGSESDVTLSAPQSGSRDVVIIAINRYGIGTESNHSAY